MYWPNHVCGNMRAGGLLPCLGIALCLLSFAVATKVCYLLSAFNVTRSEWPGAGRQRPPFTAQRPHP